MVAREPTINMAKKILQRIVDYSMSLIPHTLRGFLGGLYKLLNKARMRETIVQEHIYVYVFNVA